MKMLLSMLGLLAFTAIILSLTHPQQDPWKVPDNYEKMKNPVASDASSIKLGGELYVEHCKSCHGVYGKGDGVKAANLNPAPTDLTSEKFQKQTDGAILYKIYFGHKDMPGFKKRIPDNEDVIEGSFGKTRSPGDLINYLRTLTKK